LFAGDEVGADVILVQGDAEAGRIGELDVAVLDEGNAGETEASQKYVFRRIFGCRRWLYSSTLWRTTNRRAFRRSYPQARPHMPTAPHEEP